MSPVAPNANFLTAASTGGLALPLGPGRSVLPYVLMINEELLCNENDQAHVERSADKHTQVGLGGRRTLQQLADGKKIGGLHHLWGDDDVIFLDNPTFLVDVSHHKLWAYLLTLLILLQVMSMLLLVSGFEGPTILSSTS
jgi:hypothetical protein